MSVQSGVADRRQALRAGFSGRQIGRRLETGTWQRVYPGVYATFTGVLPREARLWAAVRYAGDGAMLSHHSAAELHGIVDVPYGGEIHVTVPLRRRPARDRPVRGLVLHRSDQSEPYPAGPFKLPRTAAADTVLDLVAAAPAFDHGYAWIARAVSRQLVSTPELRKALAARSRMRWRAWLEDALEDADHGVHSSLERRYLTDVERAHALPPLQRQARRAVNGKVHYKDGLYAEYGIAIEIDGPAYHRDERVRLDQDRDNANLALDGVKTFRFGPVAVTEQACQTAALVAAALRRSGWTGPPQACRRSSCALKATGAKTVDVY